MIRKFLIPLTTLTILAISTARFLPNQESDAFKIDNLFFAQGSYIFIQPPQQIAAGAIATPQSSHDSRYIAFLSDPVANLAASYVPPENRDDEGYEGEEEDSIDPGPRRSLYIYDIKNGQTTQAFNLEGQNIKPIGYLWLPNSPYLYIEYVKDGRPLRWLYNSTNQSKKILPAAPNGIEFWNHLYIGSSNELVSITGFYKDDEQIGVTLYITNIDSGQQRTINIKGWDYASFTTDGKDLLISEYEYSVSSQGNEQPLTFKVNLTTGELTPGKPALKEELETYDVWCYNSRCVISSENLDGNAEPKYTDYETVLSPEGINGGATLDRQFAFYTTRSGLFLARLQPINENQLYQNFAPAIKAKALRNAKSIGTGIMIYCADYDDMLPLAGDIRNSVMPYVKNASLFEGFQYLLNGESATSIDDVSNTPMGMIQTPFGTAIVRTDTSVIWKDINDPLTEVHF